MAKKKKKSTTLTITTSKTTENNKCHFHKDVEKFEPSYIVHGNIKFYGK